MLHPGSESLLFEFDLGLTSGELRFELDSRHFGLNAQGLIGFD